MVHIYGDNINTDVIIPARFLTSSDGEILKEHCMEDIDKHFAKNVKDGDIIVGGENFGCGSSREHAPLAIKASGIRCVIAKSFARIFYRNAINIGLPILECKEALDIEKNNQIEIDFNAGKIFNKTKNKIYLTEKYPSFIQNIIASGGLLNFLKEQNENF